VQQDRVGGPLTLGDGEETHVRFRVYAGVVLFGWAAVVVGAQKITTPEELDKIMKKSGPAMQATQKAIGASSFAEARKQMATVKQAVVDSQSFWVEHKREDAIKFNKESVAKMDEFEKLLSADKVDPAAATAALKAVGASCRACHQVYRATDAENNFILKPGSMG
jgi:cytochrome c556